MNTPWYFELLEIEATQDARLIKRAYAVALKRLDQETQAQAFAQLRQAYEQALGWRADGEDADEHETPAVEQAAPTPDNIEPANPLTRPAVECAHPAQHTVALEVETLNSVFGRFIKAVSQDPENAAESLEKALKTDVLISLQGREAFEMELVGWLYRHERPLWGSLFEVAAIRFGWGHRTCFLSGGNWLALRVRQWCHWQEEEASWRLIVMGAAAQARSGKIDKAPRDQLLNSQKALHTACERYPQWMSLHLTQDQLRDWDARVGVLIRPSFWRRLSSGEVSWWGNRSPAAGPLLLLGFVLAVVMISRVLHNDSSSRAPEISRSLMSFKPSSLLCTERAKLGGHWAQLYNNELTYRSFKEEVADCLAAKLWPVEGMSAQEYLRRLKHAWRNRDDPNNASMVGREPGINESAKHAPSLACANPYVDPSIDPLAGDCVALAGTFFHERANSSPVSPDFCAARAKSAGGWNFDKGTEWQSYLSFRQEVIDCLAKSWWPGGREGADAYLDEMIDYWRGRHPQLIAHISTFPMTGGSQLIVGSRGRPAVRADGVQGSGDVRVNGKPIAADPDVPSVDPD